MKKVLFLPFLQIETGHHHVANALMDKLQKDQEIFCSTREILSDRLGQLEIIVSKTYLQWIHHFPGSYNWLYQKLVCQKEEKKSRYLMYEFLFLNKMKEIVVEEQPDLIVCTHALPSYMLNRLKQINKVSTPVVNVYTDYFVHNLWGLDYIDYHFVSTTKMKKDLINNDVSPHNIFLTGIPTHSSITNDIKSYSVKNNYNVLIAGGSLGVGFCEEFTEQINDQHINYFVLCGKNEKLYAALNQKTNKRITPLSYIESKEDMNILYKKMDAIITKPGGVTISECIKKHLPIFVYDALPGQEQVNLTELQNLGLIFHSKQWRENKNIEEDLIKILSDKKIMDEYFWRINKYKKMVTTDINILNEIIHDNKMSKAHKI
ncbi:MGDG synthase family glycosyltransferase [Bacillaceae bacterium W0354]